MLPSTERWLFGPGPSLVTPRVMRALAAPVLGHLDPDFLAVMDDLRARLARVARAPEGSLALAVSGTGTAAMETSVANLVGPGRRVLVEPLPGGGRQRGQRIRDQGADEVDIGRERRGALDARVRRGHDGGPLEQLVRRRASREGAPGVLEAPPGVPL